MLGNRWGGEKAGLGDSVEGLGEEENRMVLEELPNCWWRGLELVSRLLGECECGDCDHGYVVCMG
jgi:hypothetical protein